MPIERTNLYLDVYPRRPGFRERYASRSGPAVVARLGAGAAFFGGNGRACRGSAGRNRSAEESAGAVSVPAWRERHDRPYKTMHVNVRGNPHTLGDPVPERFLSVLSPPDPKPFAKGSGRLELADAIVASPIAARVIVNRVWKWHFGSGIVETPDNFGKMGDPPSDPELLEYLASSFVKNGMSIKKLHREILLSSTYQLSTESSPENAEKDGANRLYWRANRQRLDAEAIRDSLLFVAGDTGSEEDRRAVHRLRRRQLPPHGLLQDQPLPAGQFPAGIRFSESVLHRRAALHHQCSAATPVFHEQQFCVQAGARLLPSACTTKPTTRRGFRRRIAFCLGARRAKRRPRPASISCRPIRRRPEMQVAGQPTTAWNEYTRVLLSSNEFEFVN